MVLEKLQITRGRNELLIASNGQEYIDFISGFGAVLLGHNNQPIVDRVRKQLDEVWLTGRLQVPVIEEAASLVTSGLDESYRHLQFYSTGNEAIEFAIRMATTATQRQALVGFDRSMHGKSIVASALSWENDFVDAKNVYSLPFVDSCSESEILEQLKRTLLLRSVAAVFLELIQGTNGAHEASPEFYRAVSDLCREHGTMCVVDEVLTGFYRSGCISYSQRIGLAPDILIFGKAMGNGFPVSAVVCKSEIDVTVAMLPGSTYSNNPLVASAVAATLSEMQRLDMETLLESVDMAIRTELSSLQQHGVSLRGRGALWVLELPDSRSALNVQATVLSANIVVSVNGRFVRLLPPATISSANLHKGLQIVGEACLTTLQA